MVARQTQSPTTATDKVARLGELHAELRKTVGQGSRALTDSNGNDLVMNGGHSPQLTSSDHDVAIQWVEDGSVAVTNAAGTAYAPLTVGTTVAEGNLSASADLTVSGVGFVEGNFTGGATVTANGGFVAGNTSSLHQINTGFFPIFTGDVHCVNVFYTGSLVPSDGRLKEQLQPVPPPVLDRLLAAPVQQWKWKAKWAWDDQRGEWHNAAPDDRAHFHPLAQDLPPELVATAPDGSLAVDPMSVTGALLALVQRQQAQIDQLSHRLAALDHGPVNPPNPGPASP